MDLIRLVHKSSKTGGGGGGGALANRRPHGPLQTVPSLNLSPFLAGGNESISTQWSQADKTHVKPFF